MWFIPLSDGATSVGAVAWPYYMKSRKKPVRDFFLDTIAMCAPLAKRLPSAELVSEVEATATIPIAATPSGSSGQNYLLAGDAYTFVDPMFSSGVLMAMTTAVAAAEAVDTCLKEPARAAAALKEFDRVSRHGPKEYSWFIYRVTNPTMRDLFMAPRNVLRMKEAMLGLLAGRHLRQDADLDLLARLQGGLLHRLVREPQAFARRLTAPAPQHPTRRARPDDRGLMALMFKNRAPSRLPSTCRARGGPVGGRHGRRDFRWVAPPARRRTRGPRGGNQHAGAGRRPANSARSGEHSRRVDRGSAAGCAIARGATCCLDVSR